MKKRTIFVLSALVCIILTCCGTLRNSSRFTTDGDTAKSSSAVESDVSAADGITAGNGDTADGGVEESSDMAESGAEENRNGTAGTLHLPEKAEEPSEESFGKVAPVPALPETGSSLSAFVPRDWELKDSVSFDYNGDGIMDFAAVLELSGESEEEVFYRLSPRILFAVYGEREGGFRLDFQDINLVRARSEGGVFGDPYVPLTAEGSSFTVHSYGGSAWKWSEARTFTWREGIWYLTLDESSYGYGWYVTHYSRDDYDGGTALRQRRSDEFSDMEKVWEAMEGEGMDGGEIPFGLTYELPLGEPPTLKQAGMRWWLAPDRMAEKPVDEIVMAEDVNLSYGQVKLPDDVSLFDDQNETSLLYHFFAEDGGPCYIALYQMEEKKLSVITAADQERFCEVAGLYQGKIYYVLEVRNTDRNHEVIGLDLYRMDPDGKNRQLVYGWLLAEEEQENPPYLSMTCEFGKDEMVVKIYRGDGPHPFYRMTPEGQEIRFLGQVPDL